MASGARDHPRLGQVVGKLLDRLEETFIASLIAAATVIIFVAVVHRFLGGIEAIYPYVQGFDLSWAQELCIFLFVWMAKFGAAYGVRSGIHVGVDVLVNRLAPESRGRVILFGLLSGALFTGVVGSLGANFVWRIAHTSQVSPDLEAPMWVVYLAVPLGSYLMCFRFLQVAYAFAREGVLPRHDHGFVEGLGTPDGPAAPDLFARTSDMHGTLAHPPAIAISTSAAPSSPTLSWMIVAAPLAIIAICLLAKFGLLDLAGGVRVGLIFALLVTLFVTGMPISIALGLTVLAFLFTLTSVPLESVALKLFSGIEKFEIMAIPFFILAGNLLTHGGVAQRMIRFASSLVGHWYGGLGLAGVVSCALFAAISGSSVATVVAIGSIILPAMTQQGYPKRFGVGVIATSGALGILFPPSINLVIYAVATSGMNAVGPDGRAVSSASIGQLFVAGIVPGLVLAFLLGLTTWYQAYRNDYPRLPRATWAERVDAFRESFWGLLLIAIVIGGIYSGLFTPTEAAAMAAVYAFVIAVFVYKDLSLAKLPRTLLDSAAMSAMILYIVTNAVLFSFLMVSEQIPQAMADWMSAQGLSIVAFLLLVNVMLLAAGNVMDPAAIVLIFAPILFPVAVRLGVNPVHFGIMMAVNMEIGLCHPPVGLNLYVTSGIAKMGITELTIAVWPWLLTMLGFLLIATFMPWLSLWLPRLLGMI